MADAAQAMDQGTQQAARSGTAEDIQMIEEQIDSGLQELLQLYEPYRPLDHVSTDGIEDRFHIDVDRPLPELNSGLAKAYEATDLISPNRPIYALVCDSNTPVRSHEIVTLKGFNHPNMVTLYDAETVHMSNLGENRLVLFFERPQGAPLASLLRMGRKFNDLQIYKSILPPIIELLESLHDYRISHGRINPNNIYIDKTVVLGECLSEPPGYSQFHIYDPIERSMADPIGKGEPTERSDTYAIAMVVFEVIYGLARFKAIDKREFCKRTTMLGVYNVLTAPYEIGDTFSDLFRGCLLENKDERWGIEELSNWIRGKRYNIIPPTTLQAARPFKLLELEYYNPRSLAFGMFLNWRPASQEIGGAKLDRWIDNSTNQPELAEMVERSLRAGSHESASEEIRNEMMCRVITALDPTGPLRMKGMSINVDGLGAALAQSLSENQSTGLELIRDIINYDLPTYWESLNKETKTKSSTEVVWSIQLLRSLLGDKALGFGIERICYNLNPKLACQSPLLKQYYVITMEDALLTLDALAKTHAKDTSLLDRHLAAFTTAKLNMTKEIRLHQMEKTPKLRDLEELKMLRLLSMAQERTGRKKLVGLATWAAARIEVMLENIHNRRLRKRIKQNLKAAATTGQISYVIALLLDSQIAREDFKGFSKAHALYHYNTERIQVLDDTEMFAELSGDLGGRLSIIFGYVVLAITFYFSIERYMLSY